jgi:RHH-type rel operon transcriptional repressor/antitoxin RelB
VARSIWLASVQKRSEQLRRTAENKLKVVAVRIDPVIEQRLRVLAEATGRKQSFFLQQMIEVGLDAIEETWLSPDTLAKVRSGALPDLLDERRTTSDLFGLGASDPAP